MKKIIRNIFFLLILLFPEISFSAANQQNFMLTDRQVVLYFDKYDGAVLGANMLINGVVGGTGAFLQTKKHQSFQAKNLTKIYKSRVFWQGFSQGALGGIFIYAGEKTMTFQGNYDWSILIGKQISDLGTSITYSAGYGENWFKNPSYLTDLGPIVLRWSYKRPLRPQFFILPGPAVTMSVYFLSGYDFDPEASLHTGLMVFNGKTSATFTNFRPSGSCLFNIVVIDKNLISDYTPTDYAYYWEYNQTLAHEAIHSRWSYFQFLPLDALIDYSLTKWSKNGCKKLAYLQYEKHPFRIGADMGMLLMAAPSYLAQQMDVDYGLSWVEYAPSNLFTYNSTWVR